MQSRSRLSGLSFHDCFLLGLDVVADALSVLWIAACLGAVFSCSAQAEAENDRVTHGSSPPADLRSSRDYVDEAHHEAGQLLKQAGAASIHEARLKQLRRDFDGRKISVKLSDATAEDISRFWSELDTEFLPAIEKDDQASAAESYKRLSAIHRRCCTPIPTQGKPADSHTASDDPGNGLTSILVPDVEDLAQRPPDPQEAPTMLLFALGGGLLLVAFLTTYRWIATRGAKTAPKVSNASILKETAAKAHKILDSKLMALRFSLYTLGSPHCENGQLYFGEHLMNGNNEIVDKIKAQFDCYATIFQGETRVATNILLADGARALGTPLAPGPAYDHVIRQATTFAGEVRLFGRPILGLYEPILNGPDVIGILFVGV